MGKFLSHIETQEIKIDPSLLKCSASKLREYYSSYRSICQSFSISIPQYTQIFGCNEKSFRVWQCQNRGYIQGIEMFCGLIIFSKVKFAQKVKFLFEIFDFNEQKALNYQAILFMMINICNATYKIFSSNRSIDTKQVELFMNQYFSKQTIIIHEQFFRWSQKVPEFISYFRIIKQEFQPYKSIKHISARKNSIEVKGVLKPSKEIEIQMALERKAIESLQFALKDDISEEYFNPELQWVYGIRINGNFQPLKFVQTSSEKVYSQKIIYFIGRVIIIFLPKLNRQNHYIEHTQEISCVEISNCKQYIASAQIGNFPTIHIWSLSTLKNYIKIQAIHRKSIKFLRFINNDQQLVSISQGNPNPIIVMDLNTQQIIMSTYSNENVLQISTINYEQESMHPIFGKSYFFTLGVKNITYYSLSKDNFEVHHHILSNKANSFLLCAIQHPKLKQLITAHCTKQIRLWTHDLQSSEIIYHLHEQQQTSKIIQIMMHNSDHLIILNSFTISIIKFTNNSNQCQKQIVIDSQLLNSPLISMVSINDSLLVISQIGEVIRINQMYSSIPSIHRYYQIFQMNKIGGSCFNGESMVIGVGKYLYQINSYDKELQNCIDLRQTIKTMDFFSGLKIISTISKNYNHQLLLLQGHNIIEEYKLQFDLTDVKINQYAIFGCFNDGILIFMKIEDKYFNNEPKVIQISQYNPLSILLTEISEVIFVITKQQEIYKVDIKTETQIKMTQKGDHNLVKYNQIQTNYQIEDLKIPIFISKKFKMVAMGTKNGSIKLWHDTAISYSTDECYTSIQGIAGEIINLIIQQDKFVGVGTEQVTIWRHKEYKCQEQKLKQTQNTKKIKSINSLYQEQIIKNMNYVAYQTKLNDSQLKIKFKTNEKLITDLIKRILSLKNVQPIENQDFSPELIVNIDHIFGFECQHNRNTVLYGHSYLQSNESKKYWQPAQLDKNNQSSKIIQFGHDQLLREKSYHKKCKRALVYYSGRFVIVQNHATRQQSFYQFHRNQVSAICLHPKKMMVCSAEIMPKNPQLHIWELEKKTILYQIVTKHIRSVYRLQFCKNGSKIVSLGGFMGCISIQITNWKYSEILGFRLMDILQPYDIQFNPEDENQLAVCGKGLLQIYSIAQKMIIKQQGSVRNEELTCMLYISNIYGNTIQSDIITGTAIGSFGLFICGKYIIAKENAHEKAVNCLKMAQLLGYKNVLVSCSEDLYVKIWETNFTQICKINVGEQMNIMKQLSAAEINYVPQSIDLYGCDEYRSPSDHAHPELIIGVGTRNGCIFEVSVTNQNQGVQVFQNKRSETLNYKINLNVSIFTQNHPSAAQINFEIVQNLMFTYSESLNYLTLWNLQTQKIIRFIKVRANASIVKFGAYGDHVAVAYSNSDNIDFYKVVDDTLIFHNQITLPLDYSAKLIYFSERSHKMAVFITNSHDSEQINSCIIIYELKANTKCATEGSWIYEYCQKIQQKKYSHVFWMHFSTNNKCLLIGYTQFNCLSGKKKHGENEFILWDLITCKEREGKDEDFNSLNFSPKLGLEYIYYPGITLDQDLHSCQQPVVTAMAQLQKQLIMGTVHGELLIANTSIFDVEDKQKSDQLTKRFVLSNTAITKIVVSSDYIYISSAKNTAVIRLKPQHFVSPKIPINCMDQYTQRISKHEIEHRVKYMYPKRQSLHQYKLMEEDRALQTNHHEELVLKNNESPLKEMKLELTLIIGRNALYKRNNILMDLKDNVISYSGSNLLIMPLHRNNNGRQEFMKVDVTPFSTHPEISTITISDNKRTIYIGTNEMNAQIIVWDISTKTHYYNIRLKEIVSVHNLKVSKSNKHAIVLGIHEDSSLFIIFIDLQHRKILALQKLAHSLTIIHDFCFITGHQFSLLACGRCYITEWRYEAGLLMSQKYNMDNPKDFMDLSEKKDTSQSIIFYSIIFLADLAITSGSDGYLYVWRNKKIAKKQNAHPKSAIIALNCNKNSNLFASGGVDGKAIIWQLGTNLIMQKIFQFSIYTGKQAISPVKYHIQSVCIGKNEIIIGTRSGQIRRLKYKKQEQDCAKKEGKKVANEVILSAFDNDSINSCSFSSSSHKLFLLMESGQFVVFNLETMEKVKEEKLDMSKSELVKMLTCRLSSKIFIVLKSTILVYHYIIDPNKDSNSKLKKAKQNLKSTSDIKTAILSLNEKFMAILIAPNQFQNAKIEIYFLDTLDNQFYAQYKVLQNIPFNVEIIDFSTDNGYLVYKNSDEDETVMDLISQQIINTSAIEFELEWNEQAKKNSKHIRDIVATYSEDNKLLRIVQVMNHSILITDEMGSLRVFKYPTISEEKEVTFQHFYLEHLNDVYICVLSSDSQTLVTVGRHDRSIMVWKIKDLVSKPKINQLVECGLDYEDRPQNVSQIHNQRCKVSKSELK